MNKLRNRGIIIIGIGVLYIFKVEYRNSCFGPPDNSLFIIMTSFTMVTIGLLFIFLAKKLPNS